MKLELLSSAILATTFTIGAASPLPAATAASSSTSAYAAAQPVAATEDDALVIFSKGLDGIFVDDKDAVLRDALRLIGPRLQELPTEIGQEDMPGDLLAMLADALMSPMQLQAGLLEEFDLDQRTPPFYVQLQLQGADEQAAQQRMEVLMQLMQQAGGPDMQAQPLADNPSIMEIDADGAPVFVGTGEFNGQPATIASLNVLEANAVDMNRYHLPEGVSPVMAMTYNAKAMAPLMEKVAEQGGPDAEAMMQMQMMGLTGDNASSTHAAMGYSDDRAHFVATMSNYASNPMYQTLISERTLTAAELAMIPADATVANVSHVKLNGLDDFVSAMIESVPEDQRDGMTADDMFQMIEEEIGLNPKTDVIDHLGETLGYYLSDTTGGGGLASAVMFMEVANEAGLNNTLAEWVGKANQLGQQEANGYVRFRTREVNGQKMTTLSFPGLPVPLEISYQVEDGYLWIGATPQALTGALQYKSSGSKGLMDNQNFVDGLGGGGIDGAMGVSFLDTPRLMDTGYGMATLGMSALTNALMSPTDESRSPGLILPTYMELMDGARASVSKTWIDGNDMRVHAQMDRSMLVNLVGGLGNVSATYIGASVAALGAGIVMPALGKAREAAKGAQSSAQLRQAFMAAATYAQANDGKMPESADALIEANMMTEQLLTSPDGPAGDGGADYWFKFNGQEMQYKSDEIVGYDRAMYANTTNVAVLFGDGHVEIMDTWTFLDRVQADEETDYDLPWD